MVRIHISVTVCATMASAPAAPPPSAWYEASWKLLVRIFVQDLICKRSSFWYFAEENCEQIIYEPAVLAMQKSRRFRRFSFLLQPTCVDVERTLNEPTLEARRVDKAKKEPPKVLYISRVQMRK